MSDCKDNSAHWKLDKIQESLNQILATRNSTPTASLLADIKALRLVADEFMDDDKAAIMRRGFNLARDTAAEIVGCADSAPTEDLATRIGKHTLDFAKRLGWNPADGEGTFEYVQRTSYKQGWEDGKQEGSGDVHRDSTPTDGPEFTVADPDLDALLNAVADWKTTPQNMDTGLHRMDLIKRVEARLASTPTGIGEAVAFFSTNRVSREVTLARAPVTSQHDATLYNHEPLYRAAPSAHTLSNGDVWRAIDAAMPTLARYSCPALHALSKADKEIFARSILAAATPTEQREGEAAGVRHTSFQDFIDAIEFEHIEGNVEELIRMGWDGCAQAMAASAPGEGEAKDAARLAPLGYITSTGLGRLRAGRPAAISHEAGEDKIAVFTGPQPGDDVVRDAAAVTVSLATARLIDNAFLPQNPNKLRSAAPEVIAAAHEFKALVAAAITATQPGAQAEKGGGK